MAKQPVISKFIFYILFSTAFFLGTYAYMLSSQMTTNPFNYMLDLTGFRSVEAGNEKKIQEMNTAATAQMMQVRQRTDEVTEEQNDFLNATQDAMVQQRQQAQDQQKINQQIQQAQMQQMKSQQNR